MSRILVIEDDHHSGIIVQRVLEREQNEVILVHDGISGIRLISSSQFDLILLDQGLPDLGGNTVASLIHRIPNHPPIVAMSASLDVLVSQKALHSGCVAFIQKPINTRTFASEIQGFLGEKRAQTDPPEARGYVFSSDHHTDLKAS